LIVLPIFKDTLTDGFLFPNLQEYILQFNFFQDGTIQSEIKLTGILNLYTMAEGEDAGKHG